MKKEQFAKVAGYEVADEVADVVFENVIEPAFEAVENIFTIEEFVARFDFKNIDAEQVQLKLEINEIINKIRHELYHKDNYYHGYKTKCHEIETTREKVNEFIDDKENGLFRGVGFVGNPDIPTNFKNMINGLFDKLEELQKKVK